MVDPVNLNQFRKAKAKADKVRQASENRAKHGRTKAETSLEKARAEKQARLTDAHKRDHPPEKDG